MHAKALWGHLLQRYFFVSLIMNICALNGVLASFKFLSHDLQNTTEGRYKTEMNRDQPFDWYSHPYHCPYPLNWEPGLPGQGAILLVGGATRSPEWKADHVSRSWEGRRLRRAPSQHIDQHTLDPPTPKTVTQSGQAPTWKHCSKSELVLLTGLIIYCHNRHYVFKLT